MKPRSAELTFSKTDAALVTQLYQKQFKSKDSIDTTELKLSNSNLLTLVKNSMVGIDTFNKTSNIEDKKERFEKLIEHAELFSNTADHLGTIARMAGSRDLGKIAFSMKSMAQIGGALPGLVAGIKAGSLIGMVNPVCAIVAGIFALGSVFGSDGNENDNAYQEAMIQYLQCIREEMHAGFNMVNKNIGIVYETLRQGIIHLDKLIHQQTEYLDHSITLATNRIENTVFDRADVILRGLQDIHLADLEKSVTKLGLMLDDQKKYDLKEKQEMLDSLFHWLVKGSSQPLQNGLNEFKSLQSNQTDVYKKINALITEPTDYAKNIAFLAGISKLFSTNTRISNIDLNELINPGHWIYLLNNYCAARSCLTGNFDENQYQIKEILKAGQPYLEMTDSIRQKEFFKDLFKACEIIYTDVQKTLDESIKEINKKLNSDLKSDLDITHCIKNIPKLNIPESGETGSRTLDNRWGYSVYAHINDNYSAHVDLLTPEMRFLIKLGHASIGTYVYVSSQTTIFGAKFGGSGVQQFNYSLKGGKSYTISNTTYSSIYLDSDFGSTQCRGTLINKAVIATTKTSEFSSAKEETEKKTIEVINEYRKSILTLFLKSSEQLFTKLDAMLTLLKSYSHIAGFKQDEIKLVSSLTSSKDFQKHLTDFSESKDTSATLTSLDWSGELKKVEESLLTKIDTPNYFDNKHYNAILFLMGSTMKLPDRQIATIQASKLDQLVASFTQIIERWDEFYPKNWLKEFEKSIKASLYVKYVEQYDELEAAYQKLQSELTSEHPSLQAIYSSMRLLHKLSKEHHRDLKLISQKYATKSESKYVIGDDETGLLSYDEFNAIVKPQEHIKLINRGIDTSQESEIKEIKHVSSANVSTSVVSLFSSSSSSSTNISTASTASTTSTTSLSSNTR